MYYTVHCYPNTVRITTDGLTNVSYITKHDRLKFILTCMHF
jgi:hypothetical protein